MGKILSPTAFSSSGLIVRMDAAMALRRASVISSMFIASNDIISFGLVCALLRSLVHCAHYHSFTSSSKNSLWQDHGASDGEDESGQGKSERDDSNAALFEFPRSVSEEENSRE
jgi:hypothetical protein